jgi:hypothetical protein
MLYSSHLIQKSTIWARRDTFFAVEGRGGERRDQERGEGALTGDVDVALTDRVTVYNRGED